MDHRGLWLLYLWLYTRSYDWTQQRTPIAFTASSVILLFLYSKGWSPQFLVWILVFIVLLVPTIRGIMIAITLSLSNFVEADIFLILLPEEHWIMAGTVLVRTVLLCCCCWSFWDRSGRVQKQGNGCSGSALAWRGASCWQQ